MRIQHWIWVIAVVLSGCATGAGEQLAAVGLYTPTGARGEEHCETSNHCVIRTDENGLTHVSIGEQSAVIISFSGLGGDVRHYFDYLVTIQNIGEDEIVFDPHNIDGYDEDAILEPIKKTQESLELLGSLTAVSTALGNTHNIAGIEVLAATTDQELAATESQLREQKLVAQVIPPGGKTGGRLIVKSAGEISDKIVVSIPVGLDIHTVSFDKRDLSSILQQNNASSPAYISDNFSFDGRWLFISENGAIMRLCFLRTEGNNIYEECEGGIIRSGSFSGSVATFPSNSSFVGMELTIIDRNILRFKPLEYLDLISTGIYERQ